MVPLFCSQDSQKRLSKSTYTNNIGVSKDSHAVAKPGRENSSQRITPIIRIVSTFEPMVVTTDVGNFRELVQKLTGKSSTCGGASSRKKKRVSKNRNVEKNPIWHVLGDSSEEEKESNRKENFQVLTNLDLSWSQNFQCVPVMPDLQKLSQWQFQPTAYGITNPHIKGDLLFDASLTSQSSPVDSTTSLRTESSPVDSTSSCSSSNSSFTEQDITSVLDSSGPLPEFPQFPPLANTYPDQNLFLQEHSLLLWRSIGLSSLPTGFESI